MPNSFFRFKQFTVHQTDAVLKVSTEACILGAWATAPAGATRLLDVGTGTGLLALMLAQRYPLATIDAVELAEPAARQATENVASSPFADCIWVHLAAIQKFSMFNGYDLIVANPPFYQHNLRSPHATRNTAKHAESLSFDDLLAAVRRLLAPAGAFVVLLPPFETEGFLQKAADSGLFLHRQLRISHRPGGKLFRLVSELGFPEKTAVFEEFSIHAPDGGHSPEFVALLKPYYLNF